MAYIQQLAIHLVSRLPDFLSLIPLFLLCVSVSLCLCGSILWVP